jgi:cytochrome P450
MPIPVPTPDPQTSQEALRAMIQQRSIMGGLQAFHAGLGDVFQLSLPGFESIMLVGPEANRFVLVTDKDSFVWRTDSDPVARLLGHGMLVEDGATHDDARALANPALHRRAIAGYIATMVTHTDRIMAGWRDGTRLDMMIEMRKITLNIVMATLFQVDFQPEMARLWKPLLRLLQYISPGAWMLLPGLPQPRVRRARALFDQYLYRVIRARRAQPAGDDLLGILVRQPDLTDEQVRDQVMTMIVAGHDTIAALLGWATYTLSQHPDVQTRARAEVRAVLGDAPPTMEQLGKLAYLGQVIDETLRLYPPAHLGNRRAVRDIEFNGYHIPKGARAGYSIYLTHRHPKLWQEPTQFDPDRFAQRHIPFAFVPFGGGERTCIGMNYALYEAKVVLARLLQTVELLPTGDSVREMMAVTLQPRSRGGGVFIGIKWLGRATAS